MLFEIFACHLRFLGEENVIDSMVNFVDNLPPPKNAG
jgi:hypothetical protein